MNMVNRATAVWQTELPMVRRDGVSPLGRAFLPVRHSHDYTLHSALTGNVDDCLEGWDERFTSFQAESFLWRPLLLEKLLKPANKRWRCCFTLSLGSIFCMPWMLQLLRCVEEDEKRRTYLVDLIIRPKRVLLSSRLNVMIPGVSNFCLIHWHCSTSLMNMNSTPMCWQ